MPDSENSQCVSTTLSDEGVDILIDMNVEEAVEITKVLLAGLARVEAGGSPRCREMVLGLILFLIDAVPTDMQQAVPALHEMYTAATPRSAA